MWLLIAWIIGDLVGFASAWFIAHGLGYRKGYVDGQGTVRPIPTQRRGEVNLGPKRRLIPVAVSGCDDCSAEPGERHRHHGCRGIARGGAR